MSWQEQLSEAGYRLTRPRRMVMEILINAKAPLAPLAVFKIAQRNGYGLGLVSVYRTLDLLLELGLVTLVHFSEGCHAYVLASPGHHHHIICSGCETVIEFPGVGDLDALTSRVQQETGFQVNDHLLQFYGLCPACQQAVIYKV
ncbi:MAG: Fur family transcriptional regulator [Chloroflexota bacterium]